MSKKKIVLITNSFPYTDTAETFLETEVEYWSNQDNYELIIMPMYLANKKRKLPDNISLDDSFGKYLSVKEKDIAKTIYKFFYMIVSITKLIFWKEVFTEVIKRPSIIKELLFSMRKYESYKNFLKRYIKENDIAVFYTYWNTEVTYSLQNLNHKSNYNVVTRVHRYDLYKEITFKNYMPLRQQFTKNINQVFTITDKAIDYLVETYGYHKNLIETSKLGVRDKGIITVASENNNFHIVSCSSLIPVKRVNKIIDGISILASRQKNINIKWTHIGSGNLLETLKIYAEKELTKVNIEYCFLGSLTNKEVYEFYENNMVDVFLNTSESEGVPVSIMEAMSCHIPIIAPNVGGVSDMVISNFNGVLLNSLIEAEEIAIALEKKSYFQKILIRQNSYQQFRKSYDASTNYPIFIEKIKELMSDD